MDTNSTLSLFRGFLPDDDPLTRLPSEFRPWEEMGLALPKLLVTGRVSEALINLPVINTEVLTTEAELELAMLLLSFLGHAYVWGREVPRDKIPEVIAKPWYEIALKLKRPPILSYASYALNNWRRLDHNAPVELGNIVLLQNFLGGLDEEWFVLVHVDIEMKAAPALQRFKALQNACDTGHVDELIRHLEVLVDALEHMCTTLDRMTEHCDPYIYYNRVRPYIHGWKDSPALPQGVLYENVTAYHGKRQYFRGETGAQSTIIPCFDAILGVIHQEDPMHTYLTEMRDYMPWRHRQFLQEIETGGAIREFVVAHATKELQLRDHYNTCLHLLSRFRQTHLRLAAHYIQKQSQSSLANPTETGTGGTPFMRYLKKHKDETLSFLV